MNIPHSHTLKFDDFSFEDPISHDRELLSESLIFNSTESISITYSHTPQYWIVVKSPGINIRETLELNSEIQSFLPQNSIVIGNEIHLVTLSLSNSQTKTPIPINTKEVQLMRLLISFPVVGFITVRNPLKNDIESHYLKLINITTTTVTQKPTTTTRESNLFTRHREATSKVQNAHNTNNPCNNISKFDINSDYRGGDLTSIPNPQDTPSASECCNLCYTQLTCAKWTFVNRGKQCWLKSAAAVLVNVKVTTQIDPLIDPMHINLGMDLGVPKRGHNLNSGNLLLGQEVELTSGAVRSGVLMGENNG
jgi:hypothetical protein